MKHLVWMMETAGLSAAKAGRLLRHFGDAGAVWRADPAHLAEAADLSAQEKKLLANKSLAQAEGILGKCKALGVQVMSIFDAEYPQRLKNIFDPPLILYILGRLPQMSTLPAVAIVGHRNATPYGLAAAEKIGYQLSRAGYIVVSGMAKGIDGAAHAGALKGDTPTVAVFGTAIDSVYPASNTHLFRQILQGGAVVSEYPPGKRGYPYFFPQRNRIISGLSLGTVVVEAGRKSGSLITANLALDQGRDVFAVPGSINASSSEGANDLIKKGARLISDAADVIAEYAPLYGLPAPGLAKVPPRGRPPGEPPAAPQRQSIRGAFAAADAPPLPKTGDQVLDAIEGSMDADQISAACGLPQHQVLARLTVLELEGRVCQQAGKLFCRIS